MNEEQKNQMVIWQTENGDIKVDVLLQNETVWLSLNQIAQVFERDKSVISRHLKNIFKGGELEQKAVVAKNTTTAADGKVYNVEYYNLYIILSVGYRVNSVILNFGKNARCHWQHRANSVIKAVVMLNSVQHLRRHR